MLLRKDREARRTELFQAGEKWQPPRRRAHKYGPATIQEAQMLEVLERLCFNSATKREQQVAFFKTDGRTIQTTDESLKKVLYFSGQISCRLPVKFFFLSSFEFFSKHPQTSHRTLNTTTLRFHFICFS